MKTLSPEWRHLKTEAYCISFEDEHCNHRTRILTGDYQVISAVTYILTKAQGLKTFSYFVEFILKLFLVSRPVKFMSNIPKGMNISKSLSK